MNAELLRHSIRALRFLPVQPGAAAACLSALRADGPDALPLVADSILIDPGLTALVLREGRAQSVDAALRNLGHEGAVRIAAEAARHTLDNPQWTANPMLAVLWKHAIAASTLAGAAAEKLQPGSGPRAASAGLLHDIGKLALFAIAPDACRKAQEEALAQGASLLEAEKRAFGATHALAGKWLAESWGLPPAIVHAIWLHHQPLHRLAPVHGDARLVDIVRLGNALAHAHGSGEPALGAALTPDLLLERLGLERGELPALLRSAAAVDVPYDAHGVERLQSLLDRVKAPGAAVDASERDELFRLRRIEALHGQLASAVDTEDALGALVRHAFDATAAEEVYLAWRFHVAPYYETLYARRGEPYVHALQAHEDGERNLPAFDVFARAIGRAASDWRYVALAPGGLRSGWFALDAPHGDETFLDETALAAAPALARLRDTAAARWEAEALSEASLLQHETHPPAHAETAAAGAASRVGESILPLLDSMLTRTQALRKRLEYAGDREEAAAIADLCHQARLAAVSASVLARPCRPDLQPALVNVELRKIIARRKEALSAKGFRLIERLGDGLPHVRLDTALFAHAVDCLIAEAEIGASGGRAIAFETAASANRTAASIRISFPIEGAEPPNAAINDRPGERAVPGLGIAAVRAIAAAHGGTYAARAAEGECVFTVTFPEARTEAKRPEPLEPKPQPAAERAGNEAPLILVIDRDDDLLEILRASLHLRGYRVVLAHALGEAVGRSADPALILFDHAPANASGGDTASALAAAYPGIPAIAMTADRAALRDRGARPCIQKPFSIPALLEMVAESLAPRAAAQ